LLIGGGARLLLLLLLLSLVGLVRGGCGLVGVGLGAFFFMFMFPMVVVIGSGNVHHFLEGTRLASFPERDLVLQAIGQPLVVPVREYRVTPVELTGVPKELDVVGRDFVPILHAETLQVFRRFADSIG